MNNPRLTLRAGDILFSEGDAPTTAFLVEAGALEISTVVRGHRLVLSRLGPGELIGEMAVFDAGPRSATVTALEDCVLYAIGPEQVGERLAKTDPVIRALIESLLRRYRGVLDTYRAAGPRLARDSSLPQVQLPMPEDGERRSNGRPQPGPHGEGDAGDARGVDKLRLESELREALAEDRLDVRFQPIVHIASGKVAGYEALIRWNHAERGPVSPLELVGLAEESSLIVEVGEYVFDIACGAVRRLIQAGASPSPFVAVNVSARQLEHAGLVERVIERVSAARVPRGSLKIELTESHAFDPERVAAAITLCHRNGIGVALDDFGTGYSSLAQMYRLPFDTLKIDQAFVKVLEDEPRARAVVGAIVAMARALGAQIVAEGVESDAVLQRLREMGCDYAQGFLIGQPQTLEDILTARTDA